MQVAVTALAILHLRRKSLISSDFLKGTVRAGEAEAEAHHLGGEMFQYARTSDANITMPDSASVPYAFVLR